MTVKELIEELQKFDENYKVVMSDDVGDIDVTCVEIYDESYIIVLQGGIT